MTAFENAITLADGKRVFEGQNLSSASFAMQQIYNNLGAELSQRFIFCLEGQEGSLYAQDHGLFGDHVDTAFPDAIEDISEAGKCLALQRSTAAVFHLMRAMESAVAALAEKLDAVIINKNGETLPWGVLVSNIKEKIDLLDNGAVKDDWYALHALLHSANRAFRTKTAHPKKTYSEAEALTVYHATKSFMVQMSEI